MEDFNHFVDMPTSESSVRYMYAESEHFLDAHSSGSQTSGNSPVSLDNTHVFFRKANHVVVASTIWLASWILACMRASIKA